ncbi:MAG: Lrp/AsnC family transcriptional regulator [Pseudomonadota bacterium]
MAEKTDGIQRRRRSGDQLDAVDRKLLGLLSEDATRSYAQLAECVHLSAPAVHERVKRLRERGVITATVAQLDGAQIGRPLLAFVHVHTQGWGAKDAFRSLAHEPDVEEVHSVAGDACLILKVRCASAHALEALLERLYALEGVVGTRSYIALSTYLDRGPQAQME